MIPSALRAVADETGSMAALAAILSAGAAGSVNSTSRGLVLTADNKN